MNEVSLVPGHPKDLVGRLVAGLLMLVAVSVALPLAPAAAATIPAGLTRTAATPTTVSLRWKAVSGAPMYRVQYSTKSTMVNPVSRRFTANEARIIGLEPSTAYYVRVRVITTGGASLSAYSPPVKMMTSAPVAPVASATSPLRVASYNVRCANCYAHLPNELPWSGRRDAVVAAIRDEDLDVIGIQEASQGWLKDSAGRAYDLSQFEDLQQRLGSPWELTNSRRNNCVKSTTPSRCVYQDQGASQGTRILYNSSRVQMLASGSKLLPSKADGTSPRYLAWAILLQKSTGMKFFFADSHLEDDKGYYDLRKAQAETALQTIQARNTANLPVIAVGDFNSSRFADPSNAPMTPTCAPASATRSAAKPSPCPRLTDRPALRVHLAEQLQRLRPAGLGPPHLGQRLLHRLHAHHPDAGERVGDRRPARRGRQVRRRHPLRPQHDPDDGLPARLTPTTARNS